jgi:hypothetical protein
MCDVLLPPGVNPTAVKYIIYHITTRQLMRTARMLEAEWWQVLRGSVSTGTKEDESSTGHVWAAVFHHVMTCSRLARVMWNLWTVYLLNFQFFFVFFLMGGGKTRITVYGGTSVPLTSKCGHEEGQRWVGSFSILSSRALNRHDDKSWHLWWRSWSNLLCLM